MIYITGDTHIPIDIHKLNTKNFPQQKDLMKQDYIIICGDFGGVWDGSAADKHWLQWLNDKNFTTLFVDGNHENHPMLNGYDVVTFCGGKAHRVMGSVYHLVRGQVFTIDGMKFFAMGGAASHDKHLRREGITWWPEELPSDEEYREAVLNLQANDNTVDYIITHCAPDSIQWEISDHYESDKLTEFLEAVKNEVRYKHWYFGHYHLDEDIDDRHTCVFEKMICLSENLVV